MAATEAWLAARRRAAMPGARAAGVWAGLYISLAVLFGAGLGAGTGWAAAAQFYAGYLTEYSLSLDNLFVFYMMMRWFAVPPARQHRVLMAGIVLALVLRTGLIVAGSAAVSRFGWLFYPLAGLLVWTAAGLARSRPGGQPPEPRTRLMSWLRQRARAAAGDDAGRLVTWRAGRLAPGPLLLLALAIGLADLLFAVDSIPALLGITTTAWLIVACNAFALMGLRQVYALLVRVLDRITYLTKGLAVICAFIGAKLLLEAMHGSGVAWARPVPVWLSVAVVGAVLAATVTAGALRGSLTAGRAAVSTADETRPGGTGAAGREQPVLLRRFAVFDIDGNGAWERTDYEQLTARLCDALDHAPGSATARAVAGAQRALFDELLARMDADGDQQITPDEFTSSIGRAIDDQPGFDSAVRGAARALIQAADLDGNGVLDTAELTLAIRQFFASPDASAPGNLAFGRL